MMTFRTRVSMARWRCGGVGRRDDLPHGLEHGVMEFGLGGYARQRLANE